MPQKPPPAPDKAKPGENTEAPTTPAPSGSKLPIPPPGSKLPIPPPGSKLPLPPPGGKLPIPPPSRGGFIPPRTADGAATGAGAAKTSGLPRRGGFIPPRTADGAAPGAGAARTSGPPARGGFIPPRTADGPPARGGWASRAFGRGGRIPRGPPPPPGAPPGFEDIAPPSTRGGILGAPGRRGGMYGPRYRGGLYGAPGQRGMFGARGRGGSDHLGPGGPDVPEHDDGEPIKADSETIRLSGVMKLSLGSIIRSMEMILAVFLVFLHGGNFHVITKITVAQTTSLVAFPIYLTARLSCSLWKRRWIPAVVDAVFILVAGLNYLSVCCFEIAILSDAGIVFHPKPQLNTKLNQIAISFKLFFSATLSGILILDCFIYFTRAKNIKLYCTF